MHVKRLFFIVAYPRNFVRKASQDGGVREIASARKYLQFILRVLHGIQ